MGIEFVSPEVPKFEDLTDKQLRVRRAIMSLGDYGIITKLRDCDIQIKVTENREHCKRLNDVVVIVDGVQIIPVADEEECWGYDRL